MGPTGKRLGQRHATIIVMKCEASFTIFEGRRCCDGRTGEGGRREGRKEEERIGELKWRIEEIIMGEDGG